MVLMVEVAEARLYRVVKDFPRIPVAGEYIDFPNEARLRVKRVLWWYQNGRPCLVMDTELSADALRVLGFHPIDETGKDEPFYYVLTND